MDDTAQQVNGTQSVVPAPISPAVPQPVQPVLTQAPVFHPQAVGGSHKEFVPASNRVVEAPVAEYLQPSEASPSLPTEVAEAGVEVAPNVEQPRVDDSHQKAGIELSGHSQVPVPSGGPSVQLPYTFDQATQIENKTSIDDSQHWLVSLSKYIMRKLQLKGE